MASKFKPFNFTLNFRPILLYSTSSSSAPTEESFADYLVTFLGFSKLQSLSTSTKLAQLRPTNKEVSDFNFAANADSVIDLFKQHGFDCSQIRNIVSVHPRILTAKVDKTLKPKLKIFLDLGFSRSDLAHLISRRPEILHCRLNPVIQVLRGVLGADDNVVAFLKKSKSFRVSCVKYLIPNMELLENEYDVSIDKIRKILLQQPGSYLQRTEQFRIMLSRVEEMLGIPRDSAIFFYGVRLLACNNEKSIDSKCEVFKSFGWTQYDVATLIRKNPYCLMSSEARIRNSLEILMNKLGYEPAYLAMRPFLLTYSLNKRILARHEILLLLKEKGLMITDYSLYSAVCMTESRFLKRFVLPFKEVHEVYTKQTG